MLGIVIFVIILNAFIFTVAVILLLRYIIHRLFITRTFSVNDDIILPSSEVINPSSNIINSLPAFVFGSVVGNLTGGDCPVCLSKFKRNDRLCLLPLCCHAFHSKCISMWLSINQNCPLCRSAINHTEEDIMNTIRSQNTHNHSFRVEIGSLSRRQDNTDHLPSYPVGEFDYIIDNNGCEVPVESTINRVSVDKDVFAPSAPPVPAAGIDSETLSRGWLREYIDRYPSLRFIRGSSRWSDTTAVASDIEACRAGEEISNYFSWLSTV